MVDFIRRIQISCVVSLTDSRHQRRTKSHHHPLNPPNPVAESRKRSKGKQKEKVNNMVLFDQATYDKLMSEAPKFKLITPSILSDRLRINGSLARKAIRDLMVKGTIRMVSTHSSQQINTRATCLT
nr:40S ribosomal protein S25 [Arabidopsis thaliana]